LGRFFSIFESFQLLPLGFGTDFDIPKMVALIGLIAHPFFSFSVPFLFVFIKEILVRRTMAEFFVKFEPFLFLSLGFGSDVHFQERFVPGVKSPGAPGF